MRTLLLGLALLCCFNSYGASSDIAALLDNGNLTVASTITPDSDVVPGQKLKLTLEIATDTWFSGGTRIGIPEIPGLVILQTEQFAANASERRAGQTWVVQRWTLDVYAQREGSFIIDGISLQLKVNGGSAGNLEGEVLSPAVGFNAAIPQALQQAPSWVAAPQFSVKQQFDRDLEGLVPGDAFERTIAFTGSDLMAMMLPTFTPEEFEGLAAYPAPAQLDNSNNRGEMLASRTQVISYVVETPGDYLLPALDYFWWDTRSGELQLVSLPATQIHIAGSVAATAKKTGKRLDKGQIAGIFGALLALAILAWALLRYRPWRQLPLVTEPAARFWCLLQSLGKPALPEHLNPGSNAGD